MSNAIGVRLPSASAFIADIDITGKTIVIGSVITEVADTYNARDRLEMGFSPMREIDPALQGSRLKASNSEFKVEFLTPLVGKDRGERVVIRQFGVPAIPLRFLDFPLEDPIAAVAPGRGPVLVRIPRPSRFAVHTLIVSQDRPAKEKLKVQKDLQQAWELKHAPAIVDPGAFDTAYQVAAGNGPGWKKRLEGGMKAMQALFGD